MTNLVALKEADISTLDNHRLVIDACIDAMGDILQESADINEMSICHTGFWTMVRDHGWGEAAKKLIHPDPDGRSIDKKTLNGNRGTSPSPSIKPFPMA